MLKISKIFAEIAQLVEHNLAKVRVASSSLVFRSKKVLHVGIGKVVEWSITAVLKTAVLRGTGGSNPSLSAENE